MITTTMFLLSGSLAHAGDLHAQAKAVFAPLPEVAESAENPVTEAKVTLGRALYFDPRLSLADDVSCNSCHGLDTYGVDGTSVSTGHEGLKGGRNAPTVYNAALHLAQFWDGRAADVEEQAKGPILNPIEMAMPDADAVMAKLGGIDGYAPLFAAAFPGEAEPMTYDNLGRAIGAFERTLLTPGPFDAWLGGDEAALSSAQQAGLATFVEVGCTACHAGAAVGGQMYQKLGLVRPYDDDDRGRAEVTGKAADEQVFKVPSLRNIEKTGPWFHDGSVATLDEAVRLMGAHQLGRDLSDEQVAEIVAFLGALTGPLPADTAAPALP